MALKLLCVVFLIIQGFRILNSSKFDDLRILNASNGFKTIKSLNTFILDLALFLSYIHISKYFSYFCLESTDYLMDSKKRVIIHNRESDLLTFRINAHRSQSMLVTSTSPYWRQQIIYLSSSFEARPILSSLFS